MALWRPYQEDTPLELSKTAIKETYPKMSHTMQFPMHPTIQQISTASSSSGCGSFVNSPSTSRSVAISPQSLNNSLVSTDGLSDDPEFEEYKQSALNVMAEKNGGTLIEENPRMPRVVRSTNSCQDDAYRRQRDRNNYAAKQSRDRRKLKEIHLSLKVNYLKKQVAMLKANLSTRVCVSCQQNCLCS